MEEQLERDGMNDPGICLEEKAQIVFPDGKVREGSVWQHQHGARCIYAAVYSKKASRLIFFNLTPVWKVTEGEEGRPAYQGM